MCPVPGANCGMQFPLAESPLNRKPGWPVFGYPVFGFVDMFDWLLVGLAALDQHDEGLSLRALLPLLLRWRLGRMFGRRCLRGSSLWS